MAGRPRILLLGDSIRLSYQPFVARLLGGFAEVVGPADNCSNSFYTRASLERWIGECGAPDIVHWNNGLHDIGLCPIRTPLQVPLELYLGNLQAILDELRRLTPRVVWASTTPVYSHQQGVFDETGYLPINGWQWSNKDIAEYNRHTSALMERNGVEVNDLYGLVRSRVAEYMDTDCLHLADFGQRACAVAVASAVSRMMG